VEPDRFDDVEFRIVDAPEPAPRRRGLAAIATLVVAGGMAAGATALASSDEPAARAPAAQPKVFHTSDGIRDARRGHGCLHGGGRHHNRRAAPDTALRY
jgi:hypothetical protein